MYKSIRKHTINFRKYNINTSFMWISHLLLIIAHLNRVLQTHVILISDYSACVTIKHNLNCHKDSFAEQYRRVDIVLIIGLLTRRFDKITEFRQLLLATQFMHQEFPFTNKPWRKQSSIIVITGFRLLGTFW